MELLKLIGSSIVSIVSIVKFFMYDFINLIQSAFSNFPPFVSVTVLSTFLLLIGLLVYKIVS